MDVIENLATKASQITMYDIKSYYTQAKNMVLNVPEMEAKVREATNEDAWGASSTLMLEIAQGTHNYQQFNEIMPTIYSRFMEKEAREWRQIYKALTLLEYLVKHGSERVVDDARAHISTIKMLRNFHYIDDKGKDQGINVRNRANELAALLGDVDKIRQERRKARGNRNKYQGHEGGLFNTASGSRFGGFGSESRSGAVVGAGGIGGAYAGGSGSSRGYEAEEYRASSSASRDQRTEYDEYEGADDFESEPPRRSSSMRTGAAAKAPAAPPKPAKEAPKKDVDLFSFDDDTPAAPAAAASAPVDAFGDDDFDDFQSAPSAPAAAASPSASASSGANANLFALLDAAPAQPKQAAPAPSQRPAATSPGSMGSMMGASGSGMASMGGMGGMGSMGGMASMAPGRQAQTPPAASPSAPSPAAPKKGSAFDDLFQTSLGAPSSAKPTGGKTIAQMEKEKAMSGLWGPSSTSTGGSNAPKNTASSGLEDLLL